MMSDDKENSSSVNIISDPSKTVYPPAPTVPVVKNEKPIIAPLKKEQTLVPKMKINDDIECEVILYVDNREKKNQ